MHVTWPEVPPRRKIVARTSHGRHGRGRTQVAPHGRGRYARPAGVRFLLVDGITAGTWNRAKRGKRVEIHVRSIRRSRSGSATGSSPRSRTSARSSASSPC